MGEKYIPKEALVMDVGARPIAEPRLLIQSTFEADMETLGVVAESEQVRALHIRLVRGEITREVFLEAVRAMLEAAR